MGFFDKLNSAFEELAGCDFESQARQHRGWSLENRVRESVGEEGGIVKNAYLYPDDWEILQPSRKRSLYFNHRGRFCIWGEGKDCHVENLSFNSMVASKQYPCTELVLIRGDRVTFKNCTFNGKGLRCALKCECKSIEFDNCTFKKCGHRAADRSVVRIESITKGNLHCKISFHRAKFIECCSAESIIEGDGDLFGDVQFEKCVSSNEIIRATHANEIRVS